MITNHRYFALVALLAGMLLGCGGGISKQVRTQVTFFGSFADLQRQPDRFKDEMVVLGGKIIENRTSDVGTELEVLQLELDGDDRPTDSDHSAGRFMVKTKQFLDPEIYARGDRVTVAGRVQGGETRPIGRMAYTYPVIRLVEIKKWIHQRHSPRFHFGIGFGTHF